MLFDFVHKLFEDIETKNVDESFVIPKHRAVIEFLAATGMYADDKVAVDCHEPDR